MSEHHPTDLDDEGGDHRADVPADEGSLLGVLWTVYGKAITAGLVASVVYLSAAVDDPQAGIVDAIGSLSFVEWLGLIPAALAGAGLTFAAPARRT